MAFLAEIDENNVVLRVEQISDDELLDENGVEQEALGVSYCQTTFGGTWLMSFSATGGIKRGIYAHAGFSYDASLDKFIIP